MKNLIFVKTQDSLTDRNFHKLSQYTDQLFVSIKDYGSQNSKKNRKISIFDGIIIKDISIDTTAKDIYHSLQYPINGYIVVRINANSVISDVSPNIDFDKSKKIRLQGSANCIADIWFF